VQRTERRQMPVCQSAHLHVRQGDLDSGKGPQEALAGGPLGSARRLAFVEARERVLCLLQCPAYLGFEQGQQT
jgi:hypothetical protein